VLGKDGQQVLLKHGWYYVRAHPCKLRLANCNAQQSSNKEDTTETKQTQSANPSKGREDVHDTDSDTSDSDDDVVQERNGRAPSVSSNQLTLPLQHHSNDNYLQHQQHHRFTMPEKSTQKVLKRKIMTGEGKSSPKDRNPTGMTYFEVYITWTQLTKRWNQQ
jgi:hypothetical protein